METLRHLVKKETGIIVTVQTDYVVHVYLLCFLLVNLLKCVISVSCVLLLLLCEHHWTFSTMCLKCVGKNNIHNTPAHLTLTSSTPLLIFFFIFLYYENVEKRSLGKYQKCSFMCQLAGGACQSTAVSQQLAACQPPDVTLYGTETK